jgi:hypothetical protein
MVNIRIIWNYICELKNKGKDAYVHKHFALEMYWEVEDYRY